MSSTLKNSLVFGFFFVLVVGGYYLFITRDSRQLSFETSTTDADNLLQKTEVFIKRRADLESRVLDTAIFENEQFTSLRSYSSAVPDQTIGRKDLFDSPVPVPLTRAPVIE